MLGESEIIEVIYSRRRYWDEGKRVRYRGYIGENEGKT